MGRHLLPADLKEALGFVAPGTEIRGAIENVIRGGGGGLMVFADPSGLGGVVSGGIKLRCAPTAMRLYELSKMDGAIVVAPDLSTVHYANAQLTPDSAIPSRETGLRHLAAERTARQTDALVVAISGRRGVATLYLGTHRPRVLDPVGVVLGKAESALVTLEKFARRLREQARSLSAQEYEGAVTLAEVSETLGTFEFSVRISEAIEDYVTEAGMEGALVELQLEQATHWIPRQHEALVRDYLPEDTSHEEARSRLKGLRVADLSDTTTKTAAALGYPDARSALALHPRGFRQLAQVPRLPGSVRRRLVEEFGSLEALVHASEDDLSLVRGVGETRARAIRRGLALSRELKLPVELEQPG